MTKGILVATFLILVSCGPSSQTTSKLPADRKKLADQMEYSLKNELLNKWYPQCMDSMNGGFLSTFTYDFKPHGPQDKFIVTQARHTWTTAKAYEIYPSSTYYLDCSRHGFQFLKNVMWDKTYGGFYNLVDRQGNVKSTNVVKDAYGNAFGIYALAAYYHASKDTAALNFAKEAFLWMERYSHDPVHKGYFQHLNRDGSVIARHSSTPSNSDLGYKDQNSSIHLLEAFTELYTVWPDQLVKERLEEMLKLIRDKITTEKGYLTLFLTPDWKPIDFRDSSENFIRSHKNLDHVSFGHDVETAFLMLEASHVLGLKNDQKTMQVAKRMVDHALTNGWDNNLGGFYDEAYYFKGRDTITIILDSKNWWAQAEGLNTLLLMADHFPDDPMNYYEKFKKLWNYAYTYLIDHEHGDWYERGLDKSPQQKTGLKGHIWKGTYHHFRSLSNCINRLRSRQD